MLKLISKKISANCVYLKLCIFLGWNEMIVHTKTRNLSPLGSRVCMCKKRLLINITVPNTYTVDAHDEHGIHCPLML